MRKTVSVVLPILAVAFLGCGGGDDQQGDTLTEAQANQAVASTTLALGKVDSAAVEASASGTEITATATCTGGGSASVKGRFDGAESFALDIDFNGCSESSIAMDGSLSYGGTVTENGFKLVLEGLLSYSGQVEGTCAINITMTAGGNGFSISGSACGQQLTGTIGTI